MNERFVRMLAATLIDKVMFMLGIPAIVGLILICILAFAFYF